MRQGIIIVNSTSGWGVLQVLVILLLLLMLIVSSDDRATTSCCSLAVAELRGVLVEVVASSGTMLRWTIYSLRHFNCYRVVLDRRNIVCIVILTSHTSSHSSGVHSWLIILLWFHHWQYLWKSRSILYTKFHINIYVLPLIFCHCPLWMAVSSRVNTQPWLQPS